MLARCVIGQILARYKSTTICDQVCDQVCDVDSVMEFGLKQYDVQAAANRPFADSGPLMPRMSTASRWKLLIKNPPSGWLILLTEYSHSIYLQWMFKRSTMQLHRRFECLTKWENGFVATQLIVAVERSWSRQCWSALMCSADRLHCCWALRVIYDILNNVILVNSIRGIHSRV